MQNFGDSPNNDIKLNEALEHEFQTIINVKHSLITPPYFEWKRTSNI